MQRHIIAIFTVGLLVSACAPEMDMQGHDPRDYYAKHPIQNKVETRYITQLVHFEPGAKRLDAVEAHGMQQQLSQVSAMAADMVELQMHPSQIYNRDRQDYLMSMLGRMGFAKKSMVIVGSEEVRPHDVNIQVAYAAVITPRCPDWRMSPVTSYSNALYPGNMGCATTTNLGLMVADPRDLVEGNMYPGPDTQSTTNAIQQYRSGASAESSAGGEGEGSGGAAGTSTGQ